eukprot:365904-Chlamydomonas_euryale.AAC.4
MELKLQTDKVYGSEGLLAVAWGHMIACELAAADAHTQRRPTHTPMADESLVEQLLFAGGLGFSGSEPGSHVLFGGVGLVWVAQDRAQWRALCDSALPAA